MSDSKKKIFLCLVYGFSSQSITLPSCILEKKMTAIWDILCDMLKIQVKYRGGNLHCAISTVQCDHDTKVETDFFYF